MTPATRRLATGASVLVMGLVAACAGPGSSSSAPAITTVTIGLNVPVTADPYVAQLITRGATLYADEANAAGGVKIGARSYRVSIKTYDDDGDPATAAANVGRAIADGDVAMLEDGIGMAESASRSQAAGMPEITITDGDLGLLVNSRNVPYPSLYRLGIPNDAASGLLATYIQSKTSSVALIHDDSANGRDGSTQLAQALQGNVTVTPSPIEIAAAAPTLDAQVAEVAAAKPGGLAIWGSDVFIAKVVKAVRAAGLTFPIFANQQAESPAVRQLAGAAAEGLYLVAGRMTSEGDATSFPAFEHAMARYGLGPTDAGVEDAAAQEIRQPNDVDFFAYDAVHVVVAALQKSGSPRASQTLLDDMSLVTVTSANGDARGFDSQSHEAFAAADVYIAQIHDNQFEPVKDEQLSATLPVEDEILSDFKAPS
ncbi:MAG: ABC transporter substrate-binding protein [Candidatus Dormibacteria bacterium]